MSASLVGSEMCIRDSDITVMAQQRPHAIARRCTPELRSPVLARRQDLRPAWREDRAVDPAVVALKR
eukprot:3838394-Alexandrium_andersonii.AAC.1